MAAASSSKSKAAPKASADTADEIYPMDPKKKRGTCLLFNLFKDDKESKEYGGGKDMAALKVAFKKLNFDVNDKNNHLTAKQVYDKVESVVRTEGSKSDCLAIVITGHGSKGVVCTRCAKVNIEKLVEPLKCPTLAGKPKLIFIDACRGKKYDYGQLENASNFDRDEESNSNSVKQLYIPVESDLFFFYSSPPGYKSFAYKTDGSWLIQELCKVLNASEPSNEFSHLMIRVQRMVVEKYPSKEDHSLEKQMPVTVSTLRKLIYFPTTS